MGWDFETDQEFQRELDWIENFVREEIEPLDFIVKNPFDLNDPIRQEIIPPLQKQVQERGLWACHLGPELGGLGYGQVKLALMNEILGRARSASTIFGCQAPDTGNSEILAHYGTEQQKEKFLEPLLRNEIVSCYSMTEPQGGADPKVFTANAVQDGDEWVINGEKWFSSHARFASFLIVMVVTEPDNPAYQQQSMFLVPTDTPGVEILRNVGLSYESESEDTGTHAYIRYNDVRVPKENLLGPRGGAFIVAQTRLGGGRIHHAMRTSGRVQRIFDMMCERAISRTTQGELLSKKQMVQEMIADSWIEMEMFRLLVLRTAWRIDRYNDYKLVRRDISAVKAAMPGVYRNIASRALQIHGSLGVSWEMPFGKELLESFHMGLADGPTEVHKVQVARRVLDEYVPCDDIFPSTHLPKRRAAAEAKYADVLERHLQTQ